MTSRSTKAKYDRALLIAQRQSTPSKEVYDLLLSAHEEGDARATYALATWYLHGNKFVKKNFAEGNKLLERAALKGNGDAAYDFGVSLEKGKGIKKSPRRAFEFYMRAAAVGEPQSTYELGRMYYFGIGTTKNRTLADIWLRRAEELGVSRSTSRARA